MLLRHATAVIALSLLASCSSGSAADPPSARSASSPGEAVAAETPDPGGGTGKSPGKKKRDRKTSPDPVDETPGSDGSTRPKRSGASRDPATASARILDLAGDTQDSGDPPAYTDIIRAAIDGRGRTVRLSLTMRGEVPERMPDNNTVMSVDTSLGRKKKTYSVYADGTADGWTAYISEGEDIRRLSDAFTIRGSTTIIEIPWAMIGGPGRFRWAASSSWTRTTLTTTHFSFDTAPDGYKARYPGS